VSYEEIMSKLDPKLKKKVETLSEKKETFYQSASIGLNLAANNAFAAGGRMTLLYGSSGSGKSLMMLQSIARWQQQGLTCAYIDAEGTVTKDFAQRLGVNTDELFYIRKRGMGQAVDAAMPYIQAGVNITCCDTYSDLVPDQFANEDGTIKDFDDTKQIGAQAKSTKRMIDSLMYSLHDDSALIMMSQSTMTKSGMMFVPAPYGGEKPKFEASTIVRLTSSRAGGSQIKEDVQVGDDVEQHNTGRKVKALIEKSKFGPELKTAEWNIYYDGDKLGIDFANETFKMAAHYGIIEKGSGNWWEYEGARWNGEKNASNAIRNDEELKMTLDKKICEIHGY
jgi:recombination protein RecA